MLVEVKVFLEDRKLLTKPALGHPRLRRSPSHVDDEFGDKGDGDNDYFFLSMIQT